MARDNIRGDRQAHADPAGGTVARGFEPVERLQHARHFLRRNAGAVVAHIDHHPLGAVRQFNARAAAVAVRVLDQVDHGPAQFGRIGQQRLGVARQGDVLADFRGIVHHGLQQGMHIHPLARRGGAVALAQVIQGGIDQTVHLRQVLAQAIADLVVVDAFDAQAHAGEWGAQVVGHGSQEARLLCQLGADALLHVVEGLGCGAGLGRAAVFVQRRGMHVLGQPAGAAGQALDRPGQQSRTHPGRGHNGGELEQLAQARRPKTVGAARAAWRHWGSGSALAVVRARLGVRRRRGLAPPPLFTRGRRRHLVAGHEGEPGMPRAREHTLDDRDAEQMHGQHDRGHHQEQPDEHGVVAGYPARALRLRRHR
ncbi:hypothetical protein A9975_18035 [Cupriavidus sp. UME77]|nr:hypothetical protein [Cupriavidus sp. UME77]